MKCVFLKVKVKLRLWRCWMTLLTEDKDSKADLAADSEHRGSSKEALYGRVVQSYRNCVWELKACAAAGSRTCDCAPCDEWPPNADAVQNYRAVWVSWLQGPGYDRVHASLRTRLTSTRLLSQQRLQGCSGRSAASPVCSWTHVSFLHPCSSGACKCSACLHSFFFPCAFAGFSFCVLCCLDCSLWMRFFCCFSMVTIPHWLFLCHLLGPVFGACWWAVCYASVQLCPLSAEAHKQMYGFKFPPKVSQERRPNSVLAIIVVHTRK